MEEALQERSCDFLGVGRPLCGDPYACKRMLENEIDELPRYEETKKVGVGILDWFLNLELHKMMKVVSLAALVDLEI